MTPAEFETQLRADVCGLVLEGAFVVMQDDAATTYGPGQIFTVGLGELHDEAIGPNGASVVIGRRFDAGRSAG